MKCRYLLLLFVLLTVSGWSREKPHSRTWLLAEKEVYRDTASILQQDRLERRRGVQFRKLIRGNPTRPEVLLSFDDGPHPDFTPKLLKILKKHHVQATFFVVGEMAEKHPELVRAIRDGGHTLGNHSYSHRNMSHLGRQEIAAELQACHDAVKSSAGVEMTVFRPPGGQYNAAVGNVGEALDYTMILWTDDPADYANPGDAVVERRTIRHLENGAAILLHDGSPNTLDVLDDILDRIKSDGLKCVSPQEMLKHR